MIVWCDSYGSTPSHTFIPTATFTSFILEHTFRRVVHSSVDDSDDSDDDDYSMYDDSDEGESSDNDDTGHMMKYHNQLDGADDSDVSTFTV